MRQLMAAAARPPQAATTVRLVGRFGFDLAVSVARYVGQRIPVYRRDRSEFLGEPPDFDRDVPGNPATLQRPKDGIGPLYHRAYWIYVTDQTLNAEELISAILKDPNHVVPTEMARFETVTGEPATDLKVGDELVVRLPGPWNGPVRVIEQTPTSFRFATLRGHMEAGEIEFRTSTDQRGFLEFRIESWARSGDPLFHLLYGRLVIGREIQQHMWAQFCSRVANASGGIKMSNPASSTRSFAATL
jgi:hypothetical protein